MQYSGATTRWLQTSLVMLFASNSAWTAEPQGQTAGSPAGKIVCEIRQHNGVSTMFVNGMPRFPMAFMSYYPETYRYKNMADHGVHFYSVALTLTDKWLGGDKPVKWNKPGIWRGPDELDFTVVEKALQEIVEKDPQALIFPRIYCDSPAWWDLLHPEETDELGELGGQARRQSFSSRVWRADAAAAMKKIVQFVADSRYGNHVIGYMPTAGGTEEMAKPCDSSSCAQKWFREYVFKEAGKDEKTLERLFDARKDAIEIPSAKRRSTGDCGNFLDPEKSRLVIALRQFHSQEIVDSALALCRAVKEGSDGRLIAGTFYGYTKIWPDAGHQALRRLLDSKDIDFVTTAGGVSSTETNSVLKAGKLFYSEIDARTSLSQWISKLRPDVDPQGCYNEQRWFGPPTIHESMQNLKKIFAKNLVNGWANWWFDLWGGWYDDEAFLNMFAEMQKVGDQSIRLPRKSVAQVAVVLDEKAYHYLPYGAAFRGGKFAWITAQVSAAAGMGAPHDFYLLDDLADLDLSQYRMIVFVNPFVLSEEQRQMIRTRCMTDNRTLVWTYAPGLIKNNLSVDNVSSFLGMECKIEPTHPAAKITVKMPGVEATYEGAEVSPFIHVVQDADEAIGRTSEGQVVVAEKRMPNCRNLFAAVPPLPTKILRKYAEEAGVHIYGDVSVFANESYLSVSIWGEGKRTLRLPKKAALQEVIALRKGETTMGKGQCFPPNTTFTLDASDGPCRVFRVLP
jgi:beta-galactosidase